MSTYDKRRADYYRGETIIFYIKAIDETTLNDNDFKVVLHATNSPDRLILKADMEQVTPNEYKAIIPNTETIKMALGVYTMELIVGDNETLIAMADPFILKDSHSKKYIQ
jgi:hypothetical protein